MNILEDVPSSEGVEYIQKRSAIETAIVNKCCLALEGYAGLVFCDVLIQLNVPPNLAAIVYVGNIKLR